MATTTQPDVIMTDIPQAPNQSDQLLDSLKKNRRAREIPVIALVDSLKQSIIRPTCLRLADRVLLKNSTVDSILDTAVEMIESRVRPDSTKSLRTPDRTIRVDAVFSEIGTTVTSAEPAPDSKFGTVYRQRESVNHALAAEQQRQDGHRKFDEAHDGERRAFSKIAEERLMRHLRNLNAK
jgi:DNA-binding NarL/FixJ family response regulator